MKLASGLYEGPYSFASRFEEGPGTNPEELLGAAHAGCFSMQLSGFLSADGYEPNHIHTTAIVHLDRVEGKPTIHTIELITEADVPGIDQETLETYAARARAECPISRALAVPNIELTASLVS